MWCEHDTGETGVLLWAEHNALILLVGVGIVRAALLCTG